MLKVVQSLKLQAWNDEVKTCPKLLLLTINATGIYITL
jgi:hypothetical protein